MLFGTVSSQARMSFLKTKADLRIKNINIPKGHESLYLQSESVLKQQRIGTINSKLKAGQILTQTELAFLRENAPELYVKAMKVVVERTEYREKLAKCKTKDDVQKVNSGKLQELASTSQQISSSGMDAGQKFEALEFVQMRVAGIVNEHSAFISTPEYQRLPWEHEKRRDEKKQTIKLVSNRDRLLLLEAEERERRLRDARSKSNADFAGKKEDTSEFGAAGKNTDTADFGTAGRNPGTAEFAAVGRNSVATEFAAVGRNSVAAEFAAVGRNSVAAEFAAVGRNSVAAEFAAVGRNTDIGFASQRMASATNTPIAPEARAKTAPAAPKVAVRRGSMSIIT